MKITDIFQTLFSNYISLRDNVCIWIQISLNCVTRVAVDDKSSLVQVMAWRRTGDKPLPEPMMAHFTHRKPKVTMLHHGLSVTNTACRAISDNKVGIMATRGFQCSLQWRHNGCDGVWNRQPHDCLLNRIVGRRSKKTSKLRVTGLCAGNSPVTGEFPAQMASNAENVSILWRHHVMHICITRPHWSNMVCQNHLVISLISAQFLSWLTTCLLYIYMFSTLHGQWVLRWIIIQQIGHANI